MDQTALKEFFSFDYLKNPSKENSFSDLVEICDLETIKEFKWPANHDVEETKKFFLPFIKKGSRYYIDNIQTEIKLVKVKNHLLPFTVNFAEYDNSYVCSPYSYYVTYAEETLKASSSKWLKTFAQGGLWVLAKLFQKTHFNKVIILNNWLCSTNLLPCLQKQEIALLTHYFKKNYPQHALIFRSIDQKTNPDSFSALKQLQFQMVASRQIFYTDTKRKEVFESRLFKSDLKLLQQSGYEVVEQPCLTTEEMQRILDLYNQVFIHKYSKLNPQINKNFLSLAIKQNFLQIIVLKKEGRIDGVVGYTCRNGMMTCSLFGYDKTLSPKTALYRLLSTLLMTKARELDVIFHQSAGASTYKSIRKAKNCIEYLAVYHQHLPIRRKVPWWLLKGLCNTLGIYFMKKY